MTEHGRAMLIALAVLVLSACLSFAAPTESGSGVYEKTPCTDAGAEADGDIDPSNYDHACKVDSDCFAVAFGSGCDLECKEDAINFLDQARYDRDLNAQLSRQPVCACPPCLSSADIACCVAGFCAAFRGILTCAAQAADASAE